MDSSANVFGVSDNCKAGSDDSSSLKLESIPVCMCFFAVPRCFKMIQRDAYKLVNLLPPFLKTYGYALGPLDHGRHLSDETAAEIEELETLTRDLNALQVMLGLPYIYIYPFTVHL